MMILALYLSQSVEYSQNTGNYQGCSLFVASLRPSASLLKTVPSTALTSTCVLVGFDASPESMTTWYRTSPFAATLPGDSQCSPMRLHSSTLPGCCAVAIWMA